MSLRLRLALWYGALTTLVVALVCSYSYAIHSRTHYDELDRVLVGVAEHTREMISSSPGMGSNVVETSLLPTAGISMVSPNGDPIAASAAARAAPRIDPRQIMQAPAVRPYGVVARLAPLIRPTDPGDGKFGLLRSPQGERFRVYLVPLRGSSNSLAVTTSLMHIDAAISAFGHLMLLMALIGGIVAFGAGWVLARRALRPVAALTSAADEIAESRQLSRRVVEGSGSDELARLARTFNTMLASLDDAYQAQVRFVSAASHELRAPLTVIQANLDLLESKRLSNGERETAIAEAHLEASRMTRLVRDLLVLARADAGVPIRRDAVELDRVLLEVIGETRHLAPDRRVEVTAVEPVVVRGDEDRLKQLLLNLCENAIKYTSDRGRVTVAIRREADDAIITVSDDGIGISPTDLVHVFERFYRADPARSRDPGGSGLGLSIAQWVAAEHSGKVELASRLGVGTTATVRIPLGHTS
ncbi:MAG TPA: HAMP domain-containing sensor histidine kinase [Gemmatimonadaceae bacterium]|nr:HAMP domain-containing sensor histidine kinase [Gemmatimonadaceae bacterium]